MSRSHLVPEKKPDPDLFEEFCRSLKFKLRNQPPNSQLSVDFFFDAQGRIHNHAFRTHNQQGALTLDLA